MAVQGFAIRAAERNQERKEAQRQAFRATLQKDRETAVSEALEFASIAEQAAQTGQITPEQFEQFQVGALQALQRHASTLDQNRQFVADNLQRLGGRRPRKAREIAARLSELPTGEQFINEQLPMLEARFSAAQSVAEQAQVAAQKVQTLTPDEATQLGFPSGSIVQRKPDGTLSVALSPEQAASPDVSNFQLPDGQLVGVDMNAQDAPERVAEILNQGGVRAGTPTDQQQVETLSPDEATELGFPEGAVVQRQSDGKLTLAFNPSQSESALQERVAALQLSGIEDEALALGIAAGRYVVSVNAITDERVVMDIATGQPVGEVEPPPPVSPEESFSLIPEDIETSIATGGPGVLRNVANFLSGAVNAGEVFPRAAEATEALKAIQTLTTTTLQAEVPGRPSNFLLERLEGLTVKPNSIFQGDERAKTRLEQTQRLIENEINRLENRVLPLELPPNIRVETQLNLGQLKDLNNAYTTLLGGFQSGEEEVDPEVQSLLEKYAPED